MELASVTAAGAPTVTGSLDAANASLTLHVRVYSSLIFFLIVNHSTGGNKTAFVFSPTTTPYIALTK